MNAYEYFLCGECSRYLISPQGEFKCQFTYNGERVLCAECDPNGCAECGIYNCGCKEDSQ